MYQLRTCKSFSLAANDAIVVLIRALLIHIVCPSESTAETQPKTPTAVLERSIVSFDRPFDNLGFLSEKFRQMFLYVVRS